MADNDDGRSSSRRRLKKPPPEVVDLTEDSYNDINHKVNLGDDQTKFNPKRKKGNRKESNNAIICLDDDDDDNNDQRLATGGSTDYDVIMGSIAAEEKLTFLRKRIRELQAEREGCAIDTRGGKGDDFDHGHNAIDNNNNNNKIDRKQPPRKRRKMDTSSNSTNRYDPRRDETATTITSSTVARAPATRKRTFAAAAAAAAARGGGEDYLDLMDASVRGGKNLDHSQKIEHFVDARRPEKRIQEELAHLQNQLRTIIKDGRMANIDLELVCRQQIEELESQLESTRKNAAEDIYNRNNSDGKMGTVVDNGDGRLTVDFHGLYVKDAIQKYNDIVLPILPVQKECFIITGRGRHTFKKSKPVSVAGGGKQKSSAPLRDGLLNYIQNSMEYIQGKLRCNIDSKNLGRLILRYTS